MEVIHRSHRDLLRAWLDGRESAFSEFVERHAGLVFSVAVRQIGDRSAAEEVVLDVFAALERKAWALLAHPCVPAWLHVTSRNIARRGQAKLVSHRKKLHRLNDELLASLRNFQRIESTWARRLRRVQLARLTWTSREEFPGNFKMVNHEFVALW
jgi:DNA-directed RNA polymerase specialized sigma24 family protein